MSQDNPFMQRFQRSEQQSKGYRRSSKQERELAKRIGGRTTPMSGAGRTKGDVMIPNVVRIEAKTTQAGSFRVTREMIDKIAAASLASDEIPVIVVELLDTVGKPTHEIALVPTKQLEFLLERARAPQG